MKRNQTKDKTFEVYNGRNVKQMPKLIASGRVPLTVAGLMQRRIGTRDAIDDVKAFWMDSYFDTGDAVVYHPDGRVKIVLDSQTVRDITPKSELRNGALVLTEDAYDVLQGKEFKKGKLGKIDERLSREQAKAHPVWKVLARDQALLGDYVDYIFAEGKQRFGYDTAMGVYPSSVQGDNPEMRAWCVDWLEYGSYAGGGYHLDGDYGRFVGVAPEAQNVKSYGSKMKNVVFGLSDDEITKILYPRTYTLRSQLESAVINEDYEHATTLRNQINSTDEPLK